MNQLEQLATYTTLVADTGDLDAIRQYTPEDATTNPSLLLKAMDLAEHQPLMRAATAWAAAEGGDSRTQLHNATDKLAVLVGQEILKIIRGRVSTEVDARLSFDTAATIARAKKIIGLYAEDGVDKSRVLIKIASTWEGIKAAEQLEREGINCNLTLLFSFAQAQACADAGAYLISPFVGRIFDWYKKSMGVDAFAPADDPGVRSVQRIYAHYKTYDYRTVVMGASFRNTDQILELAGCDRLTIAPALMESLAGSDATVRQILSATGNTSADPRTEMSEGAFRWESNEDAMATEKLADGIRLFAVDQVKLEQLIVA
ncbi:MAG: transaldolase [Chromatiales bacterium]|jgi:transaldolase|nr:transaldolase [Chromatiales bacterium]